MAQSFIYGFHAVTGRLRQNPKGVTEIYFDQGRQDPRGRELLKLAESQRVRIVMVDRPRLDRIVGHDKHQGVVARVEVQTEYHDVASILENLTEPPLLLVLDGVQDPHNLGACLRTADAMGVHAVVAPKDRAVGLNPTVRKVACGAAETVPFVMVTNLARTLKELKEYDVWVVGADGGADTDLPAAKLEGPLALVLGAEGEGLRRLTKETCDQLVRIPMFGTVESLNVSVASGMCLYEARRQRGGVTRLA